MIDQEEEDPRVAAGRVREALKLKARGKEPKRGPTYVRPSQLKPPRKAEVRTSTIYPGLYRYVRGQSVRYRFFCRDADGRLYGSKRFVDLKNCREEQLNYQRASERKEHGLEPRREDLKHISVYDVLNWYIHGYLKKLNEKNRLYNEQAVINTVRKHYLFDKAVVDVTKEDVWDYINKRKEGGWVDAKGDIRDGVDPASISREITMFKSAFNKAIRRKEEYSKLPNPFVGFKGSEYGYILRPRQRTLEKGELRKLLKACDGCLGDNKQYVPLAMFMAVETGMRQQEIFNLTWRDINFDKREIRITKSKTDKSTGQRGRLIFLPFWTQYILLRVALSLELGIKDNGYFDSVDDIFPSSKFAFKQVWPDLVRRAGLEPANGEQLLFKDLRRVAATRLHRAGFDEIEVGHILGHSNKKEHNADIYIKIEELDRLRDRYDRYTLNGSTGSEYMMPVREIISAYKKFIHKDHSRRTINVLKFLKDRWFEPFDELVSASVRRSPNNMKTVLSALMS